MSVMIRCDYASTPGTVQCSTPYAEFEIASVGGPHDTAEMGTHYDNRCRAHTNMIGYGYAITPLEDDGTPLVSADENAVRITVTADMASVLLEATLYFDSADLDPLTEALLDAGVVV